MPNHLEKLKIFIERADGYIIILVTLCLNQALKSDCRASIGMIRLQLQLFKIAGLDGSTTASVTQCDALI